jgi:hypothetical protein
VQSALQELRVTATLAEPARRPVLARQRGLPQLEGPSRLRPAHRVAGHDQVLLEFLGRLPCGGDRVVCEQPFLHGRTGRAEPL